jgi:lysophospholipase L1-like esterase
MPLTTSKRPLTNIVLVVLSVTLALLLGEGLARWAGVEPRFGQLLLVRGIATRTVGGVPLWSDAHPRHDADDIRRASDPTAFTILGLGDSIMYGVGQTREATYLEQLRRELAQSSKQRVEILNLAVPGYNTMQENAVYEELDPSVKPDLVLVHYWIDDTHQYRVVGGHVVDVGDISEEDGQLVVRALPLPPPVGDFLLVHSRLYDVLTQVVVAFRREALSDDWTRVTVPLAKIHERARSSGGRLVVLASVGFHTPLPEANGDLPRLLEFAAGRGIEVIDLTGWLQGYRSDEVGMDMCHFNELGHRLIAQRLAGYLLEHDLKPSDESAPRPALDRRVVGAE